MGCYYGTADPSRDFLMLARMFGEGRLPLEQLVGRTYSLGAINEAYGDMLSGRPGRGVVVF